MLLWFVKTELFLSFFWLLINNTRALGFIINAVSANLLALINYTRAFSFIINVVSANLLALMEAILRPLPPPHNK